jgi:hypothetical protein
LKEKNKKPENLEKVEMAKNSVIGIVIGAILLAVGVFILIISLLQSFNCMYSTDFFTCFLPTFLGMLFSIFLILLGFSAVVEA